MDWQPNIDCIEYILNTLLPEIKKQKIDFQFNFGGRNMNNKFLQTNSNYIISYEKIEDAGYFINQHDILLAPVFSGGGLRIKMIEAMQRGKVVLTTTIGASGIPVYYQNSPCLLIANTKIEFIQKIDLVISNFELRKSISSNAMKMIEDEFGFEKKSIQFSQYLSLLK
jgi:glycosyltransferase involved in cell wall biosynthesis